MESSRGIVRHPVPLTPPLGLAHLLFASILSKARRLKMAQLSSTVVVLSALLYVGWKIALLVGYKLALRRHGCQEAPKYRHKDPFMGLDYFFGFINAFKGGYLLDFNKSGFDEYGKTLSVNSFGTRIFKTIDPEVSKAVHATYFANFGLQGLRYDTATHLWGNGIIVVDGPHWKHGRALMRPSFEVVHLANMERLRKHTDKFLNLVPNDGSTVDLAPLFKRLVRTKRAFFAESCASRRG